MLKDQGRFGKLRMMAGKNAPLAVANARAVHSPDSSSVGKSSFWATFLAPAWSDRVPSATGTDENLGPNRSFHDITANLNCKLFLCLNHLL